MLIQTARIIKGSVINVVCLKIFYSCLKAANFSYIKLYLSSVVCRKSIIYLMGACVW